MSCYKDKHEALLKIKPWKIGPVRKGMFPQILLSKEPLYCSDGSGPGWCDQFTVNFSLCPYEVEAGVTAQITESIDLYLGLLRATPELYQLLDELVNCKPRERIVTIARARELLKGIQEPTAYAEMKDEADDPAT